MRESARERAFTPVLPSQRGGQLLTLDTKKKTHIYKHVGNRKPRMENTAVDTVKLVKMINTHKDTATETHSYCLFTRFFSYILLHFSLSYRQCGLFTAQSQLRITSAIHKVMWARITANQKLNLLFVHICAAIGRNGINSDSE